jgi:hypothetical protein
MYNNELKCTFNCDSDEDQIHALQKCLPVLTRAGIKADSVKYENIFGNINQQEETIRTYLKMDIIRTKMKEELLHTN